MRSQFASALPKALSFVLAGSTLIGCMFTLDTDGVQCRSDGDCKGEGSGGPALVCRQQVCIVASSSGDPGVDASTPDDSGSGSGMTPGEEKPKLPFAVDDAFFTSGYMGDGERQLITEHGCPAGSRGGEGRGRCHKFDYKTGPNSMGWGGLFWQYPANNWDKAPGYVIPTGAKSVAFYAWSGAAPMVATFAIGILQTDGFEVRSSEVSLTTSPTRYVIDLSDVEYEDVVGAFSFSTMAPTTGMLEIYLDDIVWSDEPAQVATGFSVDTSSAPLASGCALRLRGSFDDWDDGVVMTDEDKDGKYEVSVNLPPNQEVQYRFSTNCDGGMVDEALSDDAPCAPVKADGGPSRVAKVPHTSSQIPLTCMAECGACSAPAVQAVVP